MSSRPALRSFRPRLLIAALAASAIAPSAAQAYTVSTGESLTSIAAANGMQVARLAAANGLEWNAQVIAGQSLQIPPADGLYTSTTGQTMGYATSTTPQTSAAASTAASAASSTSSSSSGSSSSSSSSGGGSGHSVSQGDTLSAIAARLGVSLQALAAANGIADPNLILAGTTLKAPAPGTTATPAPAAVPVSTTTTATTSSTTGPEGAPAYHGNGAGNSSEKVSSSQVASIAAQHGVPGSLAAAIAWQESGNNNALTSSTGARGVMQIMPGTWEWINSNLASPKLQTHSATDNVRAGSLLLKSLLRETGGDEATAIAGYYQGLNSVRSRGMYDDTKQYVQNVLALKSRVGG